MDDIYKKIGRSLRAKRLALGMTLEDLEEASGLHASYIGQIERQVKKPSLKTLDRLAGGLGIPLQRLFALNADREPWSAEKKIALQLRSNAPGERRLVLDVMRRLAKGLKRLR